MHIIYVHWTQGVFHQKSRKEALLRVSNVFIELKEVKHKQTRFTQALNNRNQSVSDKRFSIRVEISLHTEKRNHQLTTVNTTLHNSTKLPAKSVHAQTHTHSHIHTTAVKKDYKVTKI